MFIYSKIALNLKSKTNNADYWKLKYSLVKTLFYLMDEFKEPISKLAQILKKYVSKFSTDMSTKDFFNNLDRCQSL
jgi:hypothetical protein